MSAGVRIIQRVVVDVRIAIERLRVEGPGDNRIGLSKPPQGRVVVAGVVEGMVPSG